MYVNRTEIYKFKATDDISWFNFCLVSDQKILQKMSSVSLNGTVYDFPVNHSSIFKKDILNIHQHLMIKINIK